MRLDGGDGHKAKCMSAMTTLRFGSTVGHNSLLEVEMRRKVVVWAVLGALVLAPPSEPNAPSSELISIVSWAWRAAWS